MSHFGWCKVVGLNKCGLGLAPACLPRGSLEMQTFGPYLEFTESEFLSVVPGTSHCYFNKPLVIWIFLFRYGDGSDLVFPFKRNSRHQFFSPSLFSVHPPQPKFYPWPSNLISDTQFLIRKLDIIYIFCFVED